jgi:hypothetical protein
MPQPIAAAITELETARRAVLIEIRAAFPIHFIQSPGWTVVMRMRVVLVDVYTQRIIRHIPSGCKRRRCNQKTSNKPAQTAEDSTSHRNTPT